MLKRLTRVHISHAQLRQDREVDRYPHIVDKETEAQRGSQSTRTHSEQGLELSLKYKSV